MPLIPNPKQMTLAEMKARNSICPLCKAKPRQPCIYVFANTPGTNEPMPFMHNQRFETLEEWVLYTRGEAGLTVVRR